MCTLSVDFRHRITRVTMNRDERRVRDAETPPHLWDTPAIIAPRDGKSHGTWIGVRQEDGHWAALLNGYQDGEETKLSNRSRGEIVPHILSHPNPADALYGFDARAYTSFRLITGCQDSVHELWWDGATEPVCKAHQVNQGFMRTSSSWQSSVVTRQRENLYEAWQKMGRPENENGMPLFHLIKDDDPRWSPFMARDTSATRSVTMFMINYNTIRPNIGIQYYTAADLIPASGLRHAA